MPEYNSINDMNFQLIGLNMAAQASYHAVAAILSDQGLEAALEELGSLISNADDNAIKGAVVAVVVGIYLLTCSATQAKGCNPSMFHPKRMAGALAAMLGYFGQSFFIDYWARLSCHIVDSYTRGMGLNTIIGSIGNLFTFHILTFRASFAADKKVALVSSFGAAFGMSAVMLADYFSIDSDHQPEKSILRATFASIGTAVGSVVGLGVHAVFRPCCGSKSNNTNNDRHINHTGHEEDPLIVDTEDETNANSNKSNCCVM
jgi:hypothetical protein